MAMTASSVASQPIVPLTRKEEKCGLMWSEEAKSATNLSSWLVSWVSRIA